ncbi:MAG: hypothetical protein IPJ77_05010 [Planctomycetes bacterium]|nr:hypothetical protein [Planctomycetota bacterium]
MNIVDELLALVTEFEASQLDYAVCGGLALAAHGHVRYTGDIELLIPEEQLARAVEAARRRGFTLVGRRSSLGAGTERERSIHRMSKTEGAVVMKLELVTIDAAHDATWQERERVRWRDRQLGLISRSGLLRMKRAAGRPQDLVDVQSLERGTEEQTDG